MSVIINMLDDDYAINFVKSAYLSNNRLFIGVYVHNEEDDYWEQWCDLTVNIDTLIPSGDVAFLDTNNCQKEIIDWLYKNKYAEIIGRFNTYPLVKFSKGFMDLIVIDEETFTCASQE